MNNMFEFMQNGIGLGAMTLTLDRLVLGLFFSISGFHKLFFAERHKALVNTLKENHIPLVWFNQWWVPSVEFLGGCALVTGILAPFAACGLFVICVIATCTAGLKRIPDFKPIDFTDWLDDLLYLPEVLYLIGLAIIIDFGPGSYTLLQLFQ